MIIKKIQKKINSDSGASITIIMLFMTIVIIMIAGFIVDFTRNQSIKNEYTNMAQRATQAGLIYQNSTGGLGSSSGSAAIDEYLQERQDNDSTFFMGKSASKLGTQNGVSHSKYSTTESYPRIRILYSKTRLSTTLSNSQWTDLLNNGTSADKASSFQVISTLYTPAQTVSTWASANANTLDQLNQDNYKVIYIVAEDVSTNMFMGTGNFNTSGADKAFGDPYQHYTIKVNSVAVNANNQ